MVVDSQNIVIGIDGGGTHTRVMIADLSGKILSYLEKKAAASLEKDLFAQKNVHEAVVEAIAAAGRALPDVRGIAAGIAGYDSGRDLQWVESLTDISGLSCPKWHMNDTVAAHYGAFMSKPGIVVISGTGSNILAVTEQGRYICNYDLHHYAASAARFIVYDAVYEALAGNVHETDGELIRSMLLHWGVSSMEELREVACTGFLADSRERNKKFGQLAPAITEAARQDSRLARTVCDRAIHQITVGVEILAAYFSGPSVSVAFIGSVANSPYFREQLIGRLRSGNNKAYAVIDPYLPPAAGSVLFALEKMNIPVSEAVINNLQKFSSAMI
ncbi:ATPase [Paenibacillus sp. sptzw28]|uniref:N-acetylglucosamine kinase n=1 Tax=Paenibacillus sp. sptzw28 TaxID=715179 RepID=UPI001C6F0092|nr:BadF/BadG/BcrA/BcrD ATPase family protein [Paenibacillus sp. sptzw28]QYR21836.1 ATPase [Paenibacillus sp. sptzw28]